MLDIEQPDALFAYLRSTGRIGVDEQPTIRTLYGGVSNRTVYVERPNGDAWVLKQALEKLRVQVDWFSNPERIHREALGLHWLAQLAPPNTITPLIFEDHDHHLLAMQAVPQPHANWKTLLLAGTLDSAHVEQFAHLLATIHRNAYLQREQIAPIFDDNSFFLSLRIEPYYGYTATQVPEAAHFLTTLIKDTLASRLTLVHGDYSPKNILVYNQRLILLDHEVIHFGDPAFDLGFSLTHLLSKAHHLPDLRTALTDSARLYWSTYRKTLADLDWTADLQARAVRHTLACLLARVAGRSPLEYLDASERARQRKIVVALMQNPSITVDDLSTHFVKELERHAND